MRGGIEVADGVCDVIQSSGHDRPLAQNPVARRIGASAGHSAKSFREIVAPPQWIGQAGGCSGRSILWSWGHPVHVVVMQSGWMDSKASRLTGSPIAVHINLPVGFGINPAEIADPVDATGVMDGSGVWFREPHLCVC
jgi:hypothetical protein